MIQGIRQVSAVVINTLQQAGLQAVEQFPSRRCPAHDTPVLAVEVGSVVGKNLGFFHYLGLQYDHALGTEVELFGRRLQLEVVLAAYASHAADCALALEQAADALIEQLPQAIRPHGFSWEQTTYDKETELFVRRGNLQVLASFTAQAQQESSLLLNFNLRGIIS